MQKVKDLSTWIFLIRATLNMTQKQFANFLAEDVLNHPVSWQSVSAWEQGKRKITSKDLALLVEYAKIFDIPHDYELDLKVKRTNLSKKDILKLAESGTPIYASCTLDVPEFKSKYSGYYYVTRDLKYLISEEDMFPLSVAFGSNKFLKLLRPE